MTGSHCKTSKDSDIAVVDVLFALAYTFTPIVNTKLKTYK